MNLFEEELTDYKLKNNGEQNQFCKFSKLGRPTDRTYQVNSRKGSTRRKRTQNS